MKRIVAIIGGIGAGKSVVCRAIRSLGYAVYDCDSAAKTLMNADERIKQRIAVEITADALNSDGTLNRAAISACVFSNPDKLKLLNSIVHGAVREDFKQWVESRNSTTVFVETAILYESGFDRLVTDVWEVVAPVEIRIERVMQRSKLTRKEVESRIASQTATQRSTHRLIVNDGIEPLISQLLKLLSEF